MLRILPSVVIGDYENEWETEAIINAIKRRNMELLEVMVKDVDIIRGVKEGTPER